MKSCRQSHANVYHDRSVDTVPPLLMGRPTEDRVQLGSAKYLAGTQKKKPSSKGNCFSFRKLITPIEGEPEDHAKDRLADAIALRDKVLRISLQSPGSLIPDSGRQEISPVDVEDFFLRAGFDAESVFFLTAGL